MRLPLRLLLLAVCATVSLFACKKREEPKPAVAQQPEVRYIQPPRTASVSGTLTAPDGMEPRGVLVYVEGTSHMAVTNSQGEFEISGLGADFYSFRTMSMDFEPVSLGQITLRDDDMEKVHNLGEFALKEGRARGGGIFSVATLRGVVVTTDPEDVSGVLVEATGTEARTVTDAIGNFVLANLPEGNHSIRFSKVGYRTEIRPVVVEGGRDASLEAVRLTYEDVAVVGGRTVFGSVSVVDANGRRMAQQPPVTVSLQGTAYSARADATGKFALAGLPSEGFAVVASAEGYRLREPVQVDLRAVGAAEVTLVLVADPTAAQIPGTILGTVMMKDRDRIFSQAGVTVSVAGTNIIGSTDATGLYQLLSVPPGTHSVVATFAGYKTGNSEGVVVPSDAVVQIGDIIMERDVVAPMVVATVPEDGARDVTIEDPTELVVVFSQKMDPASVEEAIGVSPEVDYLVYVGSGHPLASPERAVIVLEGYSPEGYPLRFDKTYTVTVAETAMNTDGVTMDEPHSFRFTTGRAKIVDTFPRDGARSVFVGHTEPIRVYFNASVDLDGFEADRIAVKPELPSQPEYFLVNDRETGWSYMTIAAQFAFDTEYEVTIRGGLKTIGGERISNVPYTFRFTTVAAREGGEHRGDDDRMRRLNEERKRKER